MTELVALPQPYPDSLPWLDLRPFIGDTWTMSSSAWHFRGLLDGNTATIHLRTRSGTQATIGQLPEEFWPPGECVFDVFTPNKPLPFGVILSATGRLSLYNPNGQAWSDGSITNLVMQASYARAAV